MKTDPIIDEVRKVRSIISKQFDHDPKKLVEHYMKLQEKHRERLAILRHEQLRQNISGSETRISAG